MKARMFVTALFLLLAAGATVEASREQSKFYASRVKAPVHRKLSFDRNSLILAGAGDYGVSRNGTRQDGVINWAG